MRISAWSSDVCSSDLGLELGDQPQDRKAGDARHRAEHDEHEEERGQIEGRDELAEVGERFDDIFADGEGHRAKGADRREAHQHRDAVEEEIGGATCGESVWKTVYNSVVDCHLKQTNTKN